MKSLGVFCGSSLGNKPAYAAAARELGVLLARRQITLVYGGGNVGLMGVLADAALAEGGQVIGVIPQLLVDKEVAHAGLTELRIVASMTERKIAMGELSDAFIALPGGIGTLDEFFEVWTWTQLGLQRKLCGLLNVDGYFDPLIDFIERATEQGFLRPQHRAVLQVEREPQALIDRLNRL